MTKPCDDCRDLGSTFVELVDLIRKLRSEKGCPWDRAQTPGTVIPYMIEEAFEAAEAFESGDPDDFKGELGDLLFQVLFLIEMEEEAGRFTFHATVKGVLEKMIRRHPHVFSDVEVRSVSDVVEIWHRVKRREAGERPEVPFASVPRSLPALMLAQRIGERASKLGFDWKDAGGVIEKAEEEFRELRDSLETFGEKHPSVREEMGDVLFSLVNLCRRLDLPAEGVLRSAVFKFVKRFARMTRTLEDRGMAPGEASLEEMDAAWDAWKSSEESFFSSNPQLQIETEERLGYRFIRRDLLEQALCHDSYAHEHPEAFQESNERFEFLGDAVLSFLISAKLVRRFPQAQEGDLSKMRSALVNTSSLAQAARTLGLDRSVLLGRGEEASNGRSKESILSDVMEAVLAAVYLDGGMSAAEILLERMLGDRLRGENIPEKMPDYKSRLQETTYALFKLHPEYVVCHESGPDHEKSFRVNALLNGSCAGTGEGRTKKDAAQQAAREALERIEAGWRP